MFSVLFSLTEKLRTYLSGARAPALPRAAGAAAVFLAAALVYLPVLDHDFVADDFTLIVGNDFVADKDSFSFLLNKDFLLQPYPVKLGARPLALLSLMTDHAVWGLDPFGYHLTNVLLHGLNSALLFLLVLALGARLPSGPSPGALLRLALMSGLIFALHPLQAEAVSVASFRADLLSAFFCLSSLLAFTRPRYLLSLAFFALALFSKETAVVLPLAALLYAWVFRGAERAGPFPAAAEFRAPAGRARLFYAALSGAGALFFMVHFWAERFSYPLYTAIFPALGGASPLSSAAAYVNTVSLSLLHYAGKLLLPLGLSLEYQLALPGALVNASSLAALAAGAALLACLLLCRNVWLRFGAGFFLIAYLPVSNLVPLVNTVSDRYMYLPLAGFSLLVSAVLAGDWGARLAGLRPVLERLKLPGLPRYAGRALQAGLCLALVAWYASRTSSESARFSGMHVLYSAAAAASPQNPNARYHLALAHMENGDYGSAALELEALMAVSPLYKRPDAWHLLGVCRERLGDTAGAKNYYSKVLLVRPGKETLNNLAALMRREGRADSAAWLLKMSLEIEPDPATSNNLGAYYAGKKEFGTAMTYFRQAVNLRPDYTDAWFNLLNACEAAGDKAGLRAETLRMAETFAANGWEVGAYAR